MGQQFKWHMFFTSFLPLWVSIVICDIWSLVENGYNAIISLEEAPTSIQQAIELVKDFLFENLIEVGSVLILVVYSIVCIRHLSKIIQLQESSQNKLEGSIKVARRANKLSAEFL